MTYKDKETQREYQRLWMAQRRQQWFDENGPCVDCKSWKDLELDHVNSSTKVSHRVWSWSKARRDAELEKCVVRCNNCHVVKTTLHLEHARGEANGRTNLTKEKVEQIRVQYANGNISIRQLAIKFNVGKSSIGRIVLDQVWN